MTDLDQFELRLAAAIRADTDLGVGRFDPAAIARAAIVGRRSKSLGSRLHSAVFGDALPIPRKYAPTGMLVGLAMAAVIGVLAVGVALYLIKLNQSVIGGPSPTPGLSPGAATPTPTAQPTSTPGIPGSSGPLGAGRQIHTATLLADGRVIVAGGLDFAYRPLASVTLYDPATGSFSATGSMGTARAFHTATLLPDGRVLVAGGGPPTWLYTGTNLDSAELYDPKTGTFSPTGSMTRTRWGHSATLLRDGRVLVVGGNNPDSRAVASAELYDPTTGTFTATGSMTIARGFHSATLLSDGRVLIAGGDPAAWTSGKKLASAELYDPTTGTFTATGSMATGRGSHTATLLSDGRVLIAGGHGGPPNASAEIYYPKTGTFGATGSMSTPRDFTTATMLADGRVLIAGGGGDYVSHNFLASAEIFDPATDTFTSTGSMSTARTWLQANLLNDGRVLVTGGYGPDAPLSSAEIYNPRTGTFSPVP